MLKVGDVVDIQVTEKAKNLYDKDPKGYELELGFPKTHLAHYNNAKKNKYIEGFGKVTYTFGNVIRFEVQYEKGMWEHDVKDIFLRRNKQDYREERLKKILKK